MRIVGSDQRVKQRFQLFTLMFVIKDQLTQLCAVQRAILLEYLLTKQPGDLRKRWTTRLYKLTGDNIAVNDGSAQFTEDLADGAFTAADAAGQADTQHRLVRLALNHIAPVTTNDGIAPEHGDPACGGKIGAEGDG